MLMIFELFVHVFSTTLAKLLMILLRHKKSTILLVSMFLRDLERFLINFHSLSLFLIIVCFLVLIYSPTNGMTIVKGAWSDINFHSRWIEWLSISLDLQHKNIRSITELETWLLLEYLVGTWLVGKKRPKSKKSAIIKRLSLIEKWYRNRGSYKLSQILKSPVITKRFQMLTSVFLRYFKAKWEESEYMFIKKKKLLLIEKDTKRMSLWLRISF